MPTKPTLADFETQDLLEAVDDLDSIRGILADGEHLEPPQIRIDLLKLHGLALRVCNQGHGDAGELLELATDIEYQIDDIRDAADRIAKVLRELTESEDTEYDEEDEEEDEPDGLSV